MDWCHATGPKAPPISDDPFHTNGTHPAWLVATHRTDAHVAPAERVAQVAALEHEIREAKVAPVGTTRARLRGWTIEETGCR